MLFEDRRSIANSRRLDISQAGLPSPASSSGNPYLASWLNLLGGAQTTPRIESGIVVDALPGGYMYRVSAGSRSFLWCSPGGTTGSFGTIGARPLTTYPIGTNVFFIRRHQTATVGTIVAAEPPWMLGSPELWPADGIWPFIRSGQKAETSHYWPVWEDSRVAALGDVKLNNLDIADFSAGRPMDATSSGEWGAITETGLAFFMDSWQLHMRVDEATGVFGFLQDQLLRVSGHNYQFSSSHTEHEELEDEGELTGTTRTCVYPWEAYGNWRHNQVTPGWAMSDVPNYGFASGQGTTPVDPLYVQSAYGYAVRESEAARPLPAARIFEWQGYLGQGGRSQISAPLQLDWAYPWIDQEETLASETTADIEKDNETPGGRLLLDGGAGWTGSPALRIKAGVWNRVSRTYAPANGEVGGVSAGMWISIYGTDGSNSTTGNMWRIESVSSGTITVAKESEQGRPAPSGAAVPAIVWANTSDFIVPVNERGPADLPKSQPGVLAEHKSLAGRYTLQAAGGIVFSKKATIPTPRPNKRAEDPAGDNPTNYSPSGLDDEGAVDHFVTGSLAMPAGVAQRMIALPDVLAYCFNWEGLHPFIYHEKDWVVAEEGAAGSELVNQRAPFYTDLEVIDYLDAPVPAYLDVDHRYGLVPIYETQSTFAMLEDGSIIISDGWGSEIRMGGGNIELHCSGDIRLFNGRNLLAWAGHDIDLKAQDSLDLTAERADIRTLAGRNSQHMSGNRGCGGFLFETKSVCPSYAFCDNLGEAVTGSGFVVLAPNSQVWLQGQDVVLGLEPTHTGGRIVLDSGAEREIHMRSKREIHKVEPGGAIVNLFKDHANEFTGAYTVMGGKLYVNNSVVQGNSDAVAREAQIANDYAAEFAETLFTPPGSECAEYSARTAAQYLSESFTYWQSRWKAIADGDNQSLEVWDESAVVGLRSGETTRVHPGERWTESDGEKRHDYKLTKPDDNWNSVNRTTYRSDYEHPLMLDPAGYQLRTTYRIPFLQPLTPGPASPPTPPLAGGCCASTLLNGTSVRCLSNNSDGTPLTGTWSTIPSGTATGHVHLGVIPSGDFAGEFSGRTAWMVCVDGGLRLWLWDEAGDAGTEPPDFDAPLNALDCDVKAAIFGWQGAYANMAWWIV